MLKTIFFIIVILHGLIHLLGFVKAFDYADISALTKEISKPVGILWLMAALLMVIFAFSFIFKKTFGYILLL
jgi:hypothetical protein